MKININYCLQWNLLEKGKHDLSRSRRFTAQIKFVSV